MMTFAIAPLIGAGAVRFGMSVAQVRAAIPDTAKPFYKGSPAHHPTDAFDAVGIHVFYDNHGSCVAIEFWPDSAPILSGGNLQALSFREALAHIGTLDPAVVVDGDGLESARLGIAIYCPAHTEDPSSTAQAVLVYCENYREMDCA